MVSNKKELSKSTEEVASTGCGILGRYPLLSVITFAAAGTGIGLGKNRCPRCLICCAYDLSISSSLVLGTRR